LSLVALLHSREKSLPCCRRLVFSLLPQAGSKMFAFDFFLAAAG
jgi:hypothetical protein